MKKRMDQEQEEFRMEIRRLESTTEELHGQLDRSAEEHRAMVEDYCQKIDALEKQLKSDKQFIEVCHMSVIVNLPLFLYASLDYVSSLILLILHISFVQ